MALQVNPHDQASQLLLAQKQAELLSFESRRVEGQRLRSRLKWRDKGDSMSREFFKAVQEKSTKTSIVELRSTSGDPITQQKEIEQACVDFYKDLYTASARNEQNREGERKILDAISARISPLMAASLGQPLSESELHKAACALAREKVPGPDGTSVKFFTLFWPQIGSDFHQMIQGAGREGRLPNGMTNGLITLIPKSGDLKMLTNWRPITLLNVGYKIYAKALQMRLQVPLSEIISPDQSAYLENRFILDNILLTHETLSWAKKSRQDTIFLKLDFSKAFDRVDWLFLLQIMSKMGFPQSFINMVRLTLRDAAAAINVNGFISPSFQIE